MNKENELSSSDAILGDISSFHPVDSTIPKSSGGLSKFLNRLESELENSAVQFQTQIDRINRGVSVSSDSGNEKFLVSKMQNLEQQIDILQSENEQLREAFSLIDSQNKNLEKKLALALNDNTRLKQSSKISSINSSRSPNRTVDVDKYRRALLYIDELQHRLRTN